MVFSSSTFVFFFLPVVLAAYHLAPRGLRNGLLVFFSLASGTVLGLLLAFYILPLVSLTQAAVQTVPGIIVIVPWQSVIILEATSLVALAAVVAVLATVLRRIGLGSSLRLGEE